MNASDSILIALGANLPSIAGSPRATLEAALARLQASGVSLLGRSRWYRSAPVPPSDQDWYVNGVARVDTTLDAAALLALLHEIEARFGRRREIPNEAREIDLDLLAYGRLIQHSDETLKLPHPRLVERAFVLLPLRDVAPDWRHPESGCDVEQLISALPEGWIAEVITEK